MNKMENHIPASNMSLDKEIISRSWLKAFLIFLCMFIPFAGGIILIWDWAALPSKDRLIFGMTVLICGLGAIACLFIMVSNRPRLEISNRSMKQFSLFKSNEWKWSKVGPLHVSRQNVFFSANYYVSAFTQEHHEMLVARNENAVPNFKVADINLALSLLKCNSQKKAERLADKLNEYRLRNSAGQSTIAARHSGVEYRDFKRKIRTKKMIYVGGIILAIVFVILIKLINREVIVL